MRRFSEIIKQADKFKVSKLKKQGNFYSQQEGVLDLVKNQTAQKIFQSGKIDLQDVKVYKLSNQEKKMFKIDTDEYVKLDIGEVDVLQDHQIKIQDIDFSKVEADKQIVIFPKKQKIFAIGTLNEESKDSGLDQQIYFVNQGWRFR